MFLILFIQIVIITMIISLHEVVKKGLKGERFIDLEPPLESHLNGDPCSSVTPVEASLRSRQCKSQLPLNGTRTLSVLANPIVSQGDEPCRDMTIPAHAPSTLPSMWASLPAHPVDTCRKHMVSSQNTCRQMESDRIWLCVQTSGTYVPHPQRQRRQETEPIWQRNGRRSRPFPSAAVDDDAAKPPEEV